MIRDNLSGISAVSRAGAEDQEGPPTFLTREADRLSLGELVLELRPVGPIEHTLVRQLLEHDNSAQLWRQGGQAMARRAAAMLPALAADTDDHSDHTDRLLLSALAPVAVLAAERQSHGRYRSYLLTLRVLLKLQAQRRLNAGRRGHALPPGFADEHECEAYLAAWWCERAWHCLSCGHDSGYYLPARKAWECRACHRQCGLRVGTVMAESPLSLLAWFDAIRYVLWLPGIGTRPLAERLGIHRQPTVRTMIAKIREALGQDKANELLVGLPEHFTQAAAHLSQATSESASDPEAGYTRHAFPTH